MKHHENHEGGAHAGHGAAEPGGLSASLHGYTLVLDSTGLSDGPQNVGFTVVGPDGRSVTEFEAVHEKKLHFVAVRRDMAGFQHVHPTMDAAGNWSAALDLAPGEWRFFADFQPVHHEPMTLGASASVAGTYNPRPLPDVARVDQAGEYTVTLRGALSVGTPGGLTFIVARGAEPVTTLEPYLGSFGHLIALRSEDLAYLHVHPQGAPGERATQAGPQISFIASAPSPGLYRLHLDFQHEGTVHTAQFTVEATPAAAPQRDDHHSGGRHH